MALRSSDDKYVFFSYKRDEAQGLIQRIREVSLGMICMEYDVSVLVPGKPWKPQLAQAIARSDVFVFIITPGSVASFGEQSSHPTCAWELRTALEMGKDIVPVLWGPATDYSLLPPAVSELHWVNFEDYRISGLADESAFGFAWDRLRLGINGNESAWMDESLEWYNKVHEWMHADYHADFLLTEAEMRDFERFLRRTPPKCASVLDHPLMTRFIRLNRVKWGEASPGGRH